MAQEQLKTEPLRLHVGGKTAKAGWKILDTGRRPEVDFIGTCVNLMQFRDRSIEQIYASHVLEHLSYQNELPRALVEMHRVLAPGGQLMFSVPDLSVLCQLMLSPKYSLEDHWLIMRAIYGGQMDSQDFHKFGWTWEFAQHLLLNHAKFAEARRVANFGLFEDSSILEFDGVPISLNVIAVKAR